MTIDMHDLRASRPENVRRLARALGINAAGKNYRHLCREVYRRISRRRP